MANTDVKLVNDIMLTRSDELIGSVIDGEVVLMSVEKGNYYGINAIGSYIWNILESPKTFIQVVNSLMAEYDIDEETCEAETRDFLKTMIEKNLVLIAD